MRWGNPTATPPFEPLNLAPKEKFKDILSFPELNGQFDKFTDRTEGAPVPELAEGALSKLYIYTVADASGSERYIFLPWQMLLLILGLISVASLLPLLPLPWLISAWPSFVPFNV